MSYRHARKAPSGRTSPTNEPTEFFRDTEGSGWRKCANCNRKGIKDAFYGPNKEFCSARCSKNPLLKDDVWHHAKRRLPSTGHQAKAVSRPAPAPAPDPTPQQGQQQPAGPPGKLSLTGPNLIFRNWQSLPPIRELSADPLLADLDGIFEGAIHFAPVHVFPNAPLSQCWRELIHPNILVELLHERGANQNVWFGKIEGSKGYFLKVALIGKDTKKYYFNPASINLHPVGQHRGGNYSVPFKKYNYENMLTMVGHQFTNCNTIEKDLFSSFLEERSPVYDDVMTYEAVDWSDPSHFLTGRVLKTFGEWVYLGYDLYDGGVWVHPRSGFFRPPGWCQMVGHPIQTNHNYATNSLLSFIQNEQIQEVYCNALLLEDPSSPNPFAVGMKMEVLDPFDHVMRVGTVAKILRMGFLLLKFDHDPKTLVFYKDSVHLYPASWCALNNLALQNAAGRQVTWERDVTFAEGETVAPPSFFPKKIASVGFNPGEVLETFNLRAPNVVSYGIILRIVGRLLLVDLLSEATPNGFLLDYESPHIYPFGYSNFMIHNNTDFRYDSISAEHLDRAVLAAMRHSRELCQFWLARESGVNQAPSAGALDEPETEEEVELIGELTAKPDASLNSPRMVNAENVLNLMKYGTREIANRERPIGWPRSRAFLGANPEVKAQMDKKLAPAKPRVTVGPPQGPSEPHPLPAPVSQPKIAKQNPKPAPEQPRFQAQLESESHGSTESSSPDVQLIAESPPKPKRIISESSTVEASTPKASPIIAQSISQPKAAAVAVKSPPPPPKPVQTYLKSQQTKPKIVPTPAPKAVQPKSAPTSQSTSQSSQSQPKPKTVSFRVKGYKDLPPNMTKWTAAQVFTLISGNVPLGESAAQTVKDRAFDGLSLVALIKDPRQVRDFVSVPAVEPQFAQFLGRLKEQYDLEQMEDWSAFE